MRRDLELAVRQRASNRCEYCLIPESAELLPFQIDHIIARKHDGETSIENLALSCLHCNALKGPNIAGIDPVTREHTRLFHPRTDHWAEHFTLLQNGQIVGRTAIGRTTIRVLDMNDVDARVLRSLLILEGVLDAG